MKSIAAVLAFFLVSTAFSAAAQEQCLKWTHPGGDVNQRTLEKTVADLGLPSREDEAKVIEIMRRSVVMTDDIIAEINKLGSKTERDRLTKLVRAAKKQFFAKEVVEKLGLPAGMLQTVLVNASIDMAGYQAETVGAGYTTGSMVFGRDKRATCVVLQPAPGQQQTVVIHRFTVALSDGNEWTFDNSTICSNMSIQSKKRVTKPVPVVTKPVIPPAPTTLVVKPPRDSVTLRIMAWEVSDPEFLKTIQNRQSRDLGAVVDEARKAGRIVPLGGNAGAFEVELNDLNWETARGSKVGVNNNYNFTPGMTLPAEFGPEKNTVEIPVNDGEGQLTLERKITLEESHLVIRAPGALKAVHPEGGRLYTCIAKTTQRCGGVNLGKWHKEMQTLLWIRYHFFVVRSESRQ